MEINKLSFEEGFRAIAEMCDRLDKKYDEQAELERSADRAMRKKKSLADFLAWKSRNNLSDRQYGKIDPVPPTEEQFERWIEEFEESYKG